MFCFHRNRTIYKIRKRGRTIGRIIHMNRSMLRTTYTPNSPKTTINPMRTVNSWKQVNIEKEIQNKIQNEIQNIN